MADLSDTPFLIYIYIYTMYNKYVYTIFSLLDAWTWRKKKYSWLSSLFMTVIMSLIQKKPWIV